MNGLGGAAGVLLGGIITQELSWRWVLLINPPIAIAAALVAYAVVSERRRERGDASFDLAGALTLTIGQMVLVYGVVEAGLKGWGTVAALGPIVLGLALLGVFGVIEARVASAPLIPFKELTKTLQIANNDRAAVQRGALPDVVRQLALPAAGARPLAAAHRPDLPADDA